MTPSHHGTREAEWQPARSGTRRPAHPGGDRRVATRAAGDHRLSWLPKTARSSGERSGLPARHAGSEWRSGPTRHRHGAVVLGSVRSRPGPPRGGARTDSRTPGSLDGSSVEVDAKDLLDLLGELGSGAGRLGTSQKSK